MRELLEKIRHTLVTETGLTATDRADIYNEALSDGCDHNAAYDELRATYQTIDHTALIEEIDAYLGGTHEVG